MLTNWVKTGLFVLALSLGACSSNSNNATPGTGGSGGRAGSSGGGTSGGGTSGGGTGGTGNLDAGGGDAPVDGGQTPQQVHLSIINAPTSGGIDPTTTAAPTPYSTCHQ